MRMRILIIVVLFGFLNVAFANSVGDFPNTEQTTHFDPFNKDVNVFQNKQKDSQKYCHVAVPIDPGIAKAFNYVSTTKNHPHFRGENINGRHGHIDPGIILYQG